MKAVRQITRGEEQPRRFLRKILSLLEPVREKPHAVNKTRIIHTIPFALRKCCGKIS